LRAYLFDQLSGSLIADLQPIFISCEQDHLSCTFELPGDIEAKRACLVIEGQWPGAAAGAEISLELVP
jgi:hypothetical protein